VFLTHGMGDENVRIDHFSRFWYALGDLGVQRKAWLMQVGHVDPFDLSRSLWVRTVHHWFDYWLQGVANGVMAEPQVAVETTPGVMTDTASFPLPGVKQTQLFLKPGANAGTLGLAPAQGPEQTTTFTDQANLSEANAINNPTTVTNNRRIFLSPVLTQPVRLSGTPVVQLDASANKTSTHLGAVLVDYGPAFPRVSRTSDGIQTLTTSNCWGQASATDNGCYKDVGERIDTTTTRWRVTKGVLDAGHRTSRSTTTPIAVDQRYPFSFPLLPYDYTFRPGHQIGVVIVGSNTSYGTSTSNTAAAITFSLKNSRISLPIVGGGAAALAAGVSGGEPTTTTLTGGSQTLVGAPATFTATVTGDDASALAAAPLPPDLMAEALSKADFDGFTKLGTATGAVQFLDGGQPLGAPVALTDGVAKLTTSALSGGSHQISARYLGEGAFDPSASAEVTQLVGVPGSAGGTVPATLSLTLGAPAAFGAFTPGIDHTYTASTTATIISTAGDTTLTSSDPGRMTNGAFSLPEPLAVTFSKSSWSAPTSNETVTIGFTQHIGATDALRTGTYAKTLTFTLSTTTP
jgi:X-Pro dipeptidyl-peptidase